MTPAVMMMMMSRVVLFVLTEFGEGDRKKRWTTRESKKSLCVVVFSTDENQRELREEERRSFVQENKQKQINNTEKKWKNSKRTGTKEHRGLARSLVGNLMAILVRRNSPLALYLVIASRPPPFS